VSKCHPISHFPRHFLMKKVMAYGLNQGGLERF